LKRELNDFFVEPHALPIECMYASEEVLAKDWNLPEEDEAWKNLKKVTLL